MKIQAERVIMNSQEPTTTTTAKLNYDILSREIVLVDAQTKNTDCCAFYLQKLNLGKKSQMSKFFESVFLKSQTSVILIFLEDFIFSALNRIFFFS